MLSASALAATGCVAKAADLHEQAAGGSITFSPTSPVGVASEFPRSPLTDAFVNGSVRFETVTLARAHCPGGLIVWVKTLSNFYIPAQFHQGSGFGAFMCQADALTEGDRPATSAPDP